MENKDWWKSAKPVTKEELAHLQAMLAQPIDFDAMVRDGVLTKVGAWWAVADVKTLPEHVSVKISEVKVEKGRTLIKLRTPRKR